MPSGALRWFWSYIALTGGAAVALAAAVLIGWEGRGSAEFGPTFLVLAAFVIVGELLPLRVPRGDEEGQITVSTSFAFAMLLGLGTAPAMLALVVAGMLNDILERKSPWKLVFNAANYVLSIGAAGAVLGWLSGTPAGAPVEISSTMLLAALAAALTFFFTNLAVFSVALALQRQGSWLHLIGRDLLFNGWTTGVLLSLSPLIVVIADRGLVLLPLLVVPMIALYKSASIYLEREHQALHDALTGLPNRALFHDRARQAIASGGRAGEGTALLMIDLDGFKEVNDTLGHHAGDRLLQAVADRLLHAVRRSDTVARLGGDEFGVVLWGVNDQSAVHKVVDHLREVIEEPFEMDDLTLRVEGSVGVAFAPEHGDDADTLVRRADAAMYAAKRARSGQRTYEPDDETHVARRLSLMAELRTAIEQERLILHYQPKAAFLDGSLAGVEALVRWRKDNGTLLLPGAFVPFAEQTGLMRPLTTYVLNSALRQLSAWHRSGHRLRVAVNISVRDLHDDTLPERIGTLLDRWNVDARWLELEITEQSIMTDLLRAADVLTRLRAMGVVLAIDDFGTGNTSLAHLPRLPIDVIKIDKSFIANMSTSEDVVVRTTIDLGHHLGLQVVAEGVADGESWRRLAELGCDIAQGFYVSEPVPAAEFERWLVTSGRV